MICGNDLIKALQWVPLFDEDSGVVANGDFILVTNMHARELNMLLNRNSVKVTKDDVNSFRGINSLDDLKYLKKPRYLNFKPIGPRGYDWYLQYKGLLLDYGKLEDESIDDIVARFRSYLNLGDSELALLARRSFRRYAVRSHNVTVPDDSEDCRIFGNCSRCGDTITLNRETHGDFFNFKDNSNFEHISIDFKPGIVYQLDDFGTDGFVYDNGNPYCRFTPYDKSLRRLNKRGAAVYLPYFVFTTLRQQGDLQGLAIKSDDYTEELIFHDNLNNDFYKAVSAQYKNLNIEIIMNLKRAFYEEHLDVTHLFSNNLNIEAMDVYMKFIKDMYSVDDLLAKRFDRDTLKKLYDARVSGISPKRFINKKSLTDDIFQYELNTVRDNLMNINDDLYKDGYTHDQLSYINYVLSNGEDYSYLSKYRPARTYELYRIQHYNLPMIEIADYLITKGVTGEKMQSALWMNIDPEIKGFINNIFSAFPDLDLNGMHLQDIFSRILYNRPDDKFQVISLGYYDKYGFVLYTINGKYIQFTKDSIGVFDQKKGPLWRVIKVGEKSISSINDGTTIIKQLSE